MTDYELIQILVDAVKNFGKVTTSTGYDSTATSITLSTGEGATLPDPVIDGQYNLVWWNWTDYGDPSDDPYKEIIRVTGKSGDVLTVLRAQEGTGATNKNISGRTYKMILAVTAKMIPDLQTDAQSRVNTHAALTTGTHGVGGSTIESIAGSQSKVNTHASVTSSVHNFNVSGDAPAQTHGNERHTEAYVTSASVPFIRRVASDTVRNSNDPGWRYNYTGSYVTIIAIRLDEPFVGSIRIKWQAFSYSNIGYHAIFRNGVNITGDIIYSSSVETTLSRDFTGINWLGNDLIELRTHSAVDGRETYGKNLRFCYDYDPTIVTTNL